MDQQAVSALNALAFRQQMGERLSRFLTLTDQEKRIARRYGTGELIGEVADALFLSPTTVKYHLSAIYRKLDLPEHHASTKCRDLAHLIGFVDGYDWWQFDTLDPENPGKAA